jgi:hypothetical protein
VVLLACGWNLRARQVRWWLWGVTCEHKIWYNLFLQHRAVWVRNAVGDLQPIPAVRFDLTVIIEFPALLSPIPCLIIPHPSRIPSRLQESQPMQSPASNHARTQSWLRGSCMCACRNSLVFCTHKAIWGVPTHTQVVQRVTECIMTTLPCVRASTVKANQFVSFKTLRLPAVHLITYFFTLGPWKN